MPANREDPAVARGWKKSILTLIPKRVVLKNVLTVGQWHSSPKLVRSCLKSCMLGFSIMQTKNFQTSELDLEKAKEPEIKLPTFSGSQRNQGNSRKKKKIYLCFTDYAVVFVWVITVMVVV